MKEITSELSAKDCVICMNCGRIFEGATLEDYERNSCPSCNLGWINWVTGAMDENFWGSSAAQALMERRQPV